MKHEANTSDDDVDIDIFTAISTAIGAIIHAAFCCFLGIVAIVFLVKFIFWLW